MTDSEQNDTAQDRDARVKQRSGSGEVAVTKAGKTSSSPNSTSYAGAQQPEHASSGSGELASAESMELWEQLRAKDAQILSLQKKLGHFRQWVTSLHSKVQGINPQAIKNSRRLYIGGIPNGTTEEELRQFFTSLMMRAGALTAPGPALLSCKITRERSYAFLEFRSVEEASNAMAFDGVAFKDAYLKVRRPSNYDASTAIMLGPVLPDPTLDTSSLDICRTVVEDSWNKIFIGGLPADWGDEQVKELLAPYGALRSFNLVMDKTTGKSKGYAFCEFVDQSMTDFVIKALHARTLNKKMLTVKRALEGSRQGGGKQHMGAPLGSPAAVGLVAAGGNVMQAMMHHPGVMPLDAVGAPAQFAGASGANGMLAAAGALLQSAVGPQLGSGALAGGRGSPEGSNSGNENAVSNGYPAGLHPMAVAHGYGQPGAAADSNGLLQQGAYAQQQQGQPQAQQGPQQQGQGQQQGAAQQAQPQQQAQQPQQSSGASAGAEGAHRSSSSGGSSGMYMPGTPLGGYPAQMASAGAYNNGGGAGMNGTNAGFPGGPGAMAAGAPMSGGSFPVPPQSPVAQGMVPGAVNGYGMHPGAPYW